eukprot:gene28975-34967_t
MSTSSTPQIFRKLASALLVGAFTTISLPYPSFSAVGEGDLPPGVMAFGKVLKYQKDWDKLAETIKVRKDEFSDREVLDIKVFFKQLANEYTDMELLSKSITDKGKASQALEIAKQFRKAARECDDATSQRQFDKVLDLYKTSSGLLNNYLSLLQDVPDEL